MRKWRDMDRQMEPRSQMFTQGGIRSRDWFSDRLLRALHISMVTNTDKAMVMGSGASKTSQSRPSNSGLCSVHCMK